MKAIYRIDIQPPLLIDVEPHAPRQIHLGKDLVIFEVADNKLANIVLELCGQKIEVNNGVIERSTPAILEQAFRVLIFIANAIRAETGHDAFDPATVVRRSPEIEPEDARESADFNKIGVTRGVFSQNGTSRIVSSLNPSGFVALEKHSERLATFADGLRATNPIVKYEQFYKVIEHSFSGRGDDLDKAVSVHLKAFDPKLDQSVIKSLRDVRIRCVHPRPKSRVHINPESITDLRDLNEQIGCMEYVARLLIQHPPP